jgi:adenosylmethionine-8-amino-7-oxononanoate aminotransferase
MMTDKTKNNNQSNLFYLDNIDRPELDRAEGIYLWDTNGKKYIDASSGPMVSNIGHSNQNVLNAMKKQMDRSTFGYRLHFKNKPAEELASMTASLMPKNLNKIFFTSGGSEAVESCLKLARQFAVVTNKKERWKIISLYPSYHGGTLGAVAITGMKSFVDPFSSMIKNMPKIPAPTCYLDQDELSDHERGIKYAEMLRKEILTQGPESVLAFIFEPVGGASTGALVAPDSYYHHVQEICKEFDILLILDEVMTGAGRTGKFLACEHWNLKPDIIAMAKGFAAGYAPLGVMSAREDIVETITSNGGFAHGYTYSGNPLSCSAGLAVLKEVIDEQLIKNAEIQGELLKSELIKLKNKYEFIGDVRGKGLLLAFELVANKKTMEPLPSELEAHFHLVEEAYKRGLIIYSRRSRGGNTGDHFMICPPLTINTKQIKELMNILNKSIASFAKTAKLIEK